MESKHIIVNVGRQLGAGGHDIGMMLAEDFNARYYDKEILGLAAQESGFSKEFFEQNDERHGFLRSLSLARLTHLTDNIFYQSNFSQESLFMFQSDAIRKAASEGSCVFVGRCADYVLRDFQNVVNVFITAPLSFRIDNIVSKEGISADDARKIIEQGEHRRAEYYNYYTGKKWGVAQSYDLCIDSSLLGIQQTEKFIAEFIRQRFQMD